MQNVGIVLLRKLTFSAEIDDTVEFQSIRSVNSSSSHFNSLLDYDSEGNEIPRDLKLDSSEDLSDDDDARDTGDLTSNESLNESYNEDNPIIPQPAPLHVDAPYWYKFGASMVQFPANLLGIYILFSTPK